ncbi:SRPBCC family protein [Sinorhizobium sp. BG8]|nr:SRPBCC family protein [Sinorhizobium sp. BG8]
MAEGDYGIVTAVDTLRIERLLPGPIERIWAYVTEPDKRRQWMAAGAIELFDGGAVEHIADNSKLTAKWDRPPPKYARHAGKTRSRGRVTACDPPFVIAYTWNEETETPSEVRFELAPEGDRVRLTLTHSRIASRDTMLSFAAGWHTHLDILRDALEGRAYEVFWPKHTRLEAEYGRRIPA